MTPKQQLIEDRLGRPLFDWLATQRRAGASYGTIARLIEEKTHVKVSRSALHLWV